MISFEILPWIFKHSYLGMGTVVQTFLIQKMVQLQILFKLNVTFAE